MKSKKLIIDNDHYHKSSLVPTHLSLERDEKYKNTYGFGLEFPREHENHLRFEIVSQDEEYLVIRITE